MFGWPVVIGVLIGQILGPERVECGDLAIFRISNPGVRAAWTVFPQEFRERFAEVILASGEHALVFASRKPGRITVIAAYCDGDVPTIVSHTFENVSGDQPQPPNGSEFSPPFVLLWIEESSDRTPEQAAAQNDPTIREALTKHGWQLRVVDKDVQNERGETPSELAQWIAIAKRLGIPRLLVVSRSGRYKHFPAPRNKEEFSAILRELGLPIATPQKERPSSTLRSFGIGPSIICTPAGCVPLP